jgi:hypothetical protein
MKIQTLMEIIESKSMKNVMSGKYFIGMTHLDTRNAGYFHALVIFFNSKLSDSRIETIRRKLINEHKNNGEILDKPKIIKFYGTVKQLIIS